MNCKAIIYVLLAMSENIVAISFTLIGVAQIQAIVNPDCRPMPTPSKGEVAKLLEQMSVILPLIIIHLQFRMDRKYKAILTSNISPLFGDCEEYLVDEGAKDLVLRCFNNHQCESIAPLIIQTSSHHIINVVAIFRGHEDLLGVADPSVLRQEPEDLHHLPIAQDA